MNIQVLFGIIALLVLVVAIFIFASDYTLPFLKFGNNEIPCNKIEFRPRNVLKELSRHEKNSQES